MKNFKNGFNNWKKTYFFVCTIMAQVEPESSEVINFNHLMEGDDGVIDLAERLTDQFEETHEHNEDESLYEIVDNFLTDKL